MKILLPKTQDTRAITVIWIIYSLLMGAGIYTVRAVVDRMFWEDPLLGVFFGLMFIFTIPLCLAIVSIPLGGLFVSLKHSRSLRNPLPSVIYVIGVLVSVKLPLPPLPPLPEELHFAQYRAEFEQVVLLAKGEQLEHGPTQCPAGYAVPSEYPHVSEDLCAFIRIEETNKLIVEFQPFDFYWPVIYCELPKNETRACFRDGKIQKQLDTHWYVGVREWN